MCVCVCVCTEALDSLDKHWSSFHLWTYPQEILVIINFIMGPMIYSFENIDLHGRSAFILYIYVIETYFVENLVVVDKADF